MRIMRDVLRVLAFSSALLVWCCGIAWAQWDEHIQPSEDSEPAPVQVEDNPQWDKYAFELSYIGEPGELSFHDLARANEPFVLFFWLSECPVCHMQMPYIQDFYNTINEKELEINLIMINLDFRESEALAMIEEKEITIPALLDPRARQTDEAFELSDVGTPIAFVFGPDGLPVGEVSGFSSGIAKEVFSLLKMEVSKN